MATSIGTRKNARWKSVLDFLAVAGPIICLVDCVVLPVASAILPFIGMTDIGHGISDQALVFLVLAICLPIIVPGYLKHRSARVLGMFVSAIVLMLFVNFTGIVVDEMIHAGISLTAAFLLIKANLENKKLLACACSFHHGHAPAEAHEHTPAPAFNQVLSVQDRSGDREHGSGCDHDHHHQHETGYAHVHDHGDGARVHEVIVALERKDRGLAPDHFEPKNNLNFDPQATVQLEAIAIAPAPAPVSCC